MFSIFNLKYFCFYFIINVCNESLGHAVRCLLLLLPLSHNIAIIRNISSLAIVQRLERQSSLTIQHGLEWQSPLAVI